MFKTPLMVGMLMLVAASAHGGLIPNGDFETGDFTGWLPQVGSGPVSSSTATVQFLDGSYRAVLDLDVTSGPGNTSGETLTTSNPSTWGKGHILQFDASYSYSTNSNGADVFFAVANGSNGLDILHVVQNDDTPLTGGSPWTTYSMPWDGQAIDILPFLFAPNSGDASLTVMLDNFRIIPEPSTWGLVASALGGAPFYYFRRGRQRRR